MSHPTVLLKYFVWALDQCFPNLSEFWNPQDNFVTFSKPREELSHYFWERNTVNSIFQIFSVDYNAQTSYGPLF